MASNTLAFSLGVALLFPAEEGPPKRKEKALPGPFDMGPETGTLQFTRCETWLGY